MTDAPKTGPAQLPSRDGGPGQPLRRRPADDAAAQRIEDLVCDILLSRRLRRLPRRHGRFG